MKDLQLVIGSRNVPRETFAKVKASSLGARQTLETTSTGIGLRIEVPRSRGDSSHSERQGSLQEEVLQLNRVGAGCNQASRASPVVFL